MNEWMKHPLFETLDPVKREIIEMAAAQTAGKKSHALAPVMMSIITSANKKGIRFTPEETTLIFELLKEGKSDIECQQIDRTIQLVTRTLEKKTAKKSTTQSPF